MKILCKNSFVLLWVVCFGLVLTSESQAKVCFVGDPDCAQGAEFEEYADPYENGESCTSEGYVLKTECDADASKHITGYCPYNSNYVMCCGNEYVYDACVYPLVPDGRCGNKFKCVCDPNKYPYYQSGATTCRNSVTGAEYLNSMADGAACSYTGYSSGQSMINMYFSKCACDRGLYPKTEQECTDGGSSVSNKSCTDSDGNIYYSACICGDDYKVIASECEYGIDINAEMCQQGDVLKAKKCCECNANTYPYDDIDDVTSSDSPVESYASCETEKGCTRGSRYRATSCKIGYKIVSGECVPKECDELLVDYMNERGIDDYEIYQPGTKPTARNVIVAADVPNDYNKKFEWSHFYDKRVMSAVTYVQTISGSDSLTKLAKQQCTFVPEIYISTISSSITGTLDITSLSFGGSYSASMYLKGAKFTCTNCSLKLFGLNVDSNSSVDLKYDKSLPNADNMYVDSTGIDIMGTYKAEGYDHTYGSLGFVITNPNKHSVFITGKSNSDRALITASDMYSSTAYGMTVQGVAAVRYVDIKVPKLCVGTADCNYSTAPKPYFKGSDERNTISTLSLYNSKVWLYENGSSRNLYMGTASVLGNENGGGSEIVRVDGTFKGISLIRLWDDCSDRHVSNYPYVTSSGSLSSRNVGCDWYDKGATDCNAQGKPDDITCLMTGNGGISKKHGGIKDNCEWEPKPRCNAIQEMITHY